MVRQLTLEVPRTTEADLRVRPRVRRVEDRQAVEGLRRNPMMNHLISALERGEEIGHYGRLVFAMVAHHFLDDDAMVGYLERDPRFSREEAEALCRQVRARNYSPPRPETIVDWQTSQRFPICPEGDARACNVYRDLKFPPEVYEQIEKFYS